MENNYSIYSVNVKCPRDLGFTRIVKVTCFILEDGKRLYTAAKCDTAGQTETCIRCKNAVTTLLNETQTLPHSPIAFPEL